MTETTTPGRGNGVSALLKNHRALVIIAGGGAAFLYLNHRGSSASTATIGTIVPVQSATDETATTTDPTVDDTGTFPLDPTLPAEPAIPADPAIPPDTSLPADTPAAVPTPSVDSPVASTQAPAPTVAPTPSASGVTISGTTIPGATGRTASGSGRNAFGTYTDWLVKFPSGSAHYYHYYADEHGKAKDKVTGPHEPRGTVPAGANVANDSATPLPITATAPPPSPVNTPQAFPGVPAPQSGWDAVWQIMNLNGDIWEVHHYTSGPKTGTVESHGWVSSAGQKFNTGKTAPAGWALATPGIAGKFGFQFQRQTDTRAY